MQKPNNTRNYNTLKSNLKSIRLLINSKLHKGNSLIYYLQVTCLALKITKTLQFYTIINYYIILYKVIYLLVTFIKSLIEYFFVFI